MFTVYLRGKYMYGPDTLEACISFIRKNYARDDMDRCYLVSSVGESFTFKEAVKLDKEMKE